MTNFLFLFSFSFYFYYFSSFYIINLFKIKVQFYTIESILSFCYDSFMFKKRKKQDNKKKEELIDPVLYTGDLDKEKYPFLSSEEKDKTEKELENPLNKREGKN